MTSPRTPRPGEPAVDHEETVALPGSLPGALPDAEEVPDEATQDAAAQGGERDVEMTTDVVPWATERPITPFGPGAEPASARGAALVEAPAPMSSRAAPMAIPAPRAVPAIVLADLDADARVALHATALAALASAAPAVVLPAHGLDAASFADLEAAVLEALATAMESGDAAAAARFDATYAQTRAFFLAPPHVAAWAGLSASLASDDDGSAVRALGLGIADVLCLARVWRRAVEVDPALGADLESYLAGAVAARASGETA